MNKKVIIAAILGVSLGLAGGFFGANYLNRQDISASVSQAGNIPQIPNSGSTPQQASKTRGAAMIGDVQETIDRANREPDNYEAQIKAGEMFGRIKRFDDSIKYYQQAQKIKPNDPKANELLGNAYFDAENYVEAGKYYEFSLKNNPEDISVRTDLGLTFYLRQPQDLDRAISEYQASLSIKPNDEATLQNLAIAQKEKGDKSGFDLTVNKLREINPNNPLVSSAN